MPYPSRRIWGGRVDSWLKPYDGNVPVTAQYKSVKFTPFSKEKAPKVTAKPAATAPKKEMREYTDDGNLVYDGDFADAAGLGDGKVWSFFTVGGGVGAASISEGVLTIITENCGDLPYSIQLVQPNLPMVKGKKYTLTFEAKASEERKAVTGISAPDANWIRYFPDTTIDVGTDWQEYKADFEMDKADDPNGRLEYNLGNLGSTATFELRNVRVAEAQ